MTDSNEKLVRELKEQFKKASNLLEKAELIKEAQAQTGFSVSSLSAYTGAFNSITGRLFVELLDAPEWIKSLAKGNRISVTVASAIQKKTSDEIECVRNMLESNSELKITRTDFLENLLINWGVRSRGSVSPTPKSMVSSVVVTPKSRQVATGEKKPVSGSNGSNGGHQPKVSTSELSRIPTPEVHSFVLIVADLNIALLRFSMLDGADISGLSTFDAGTLYNLLERTSPFSEKIKAKIRSCHPGIRTMIDGEKKEIVRQ